MTLQARNFGVFEGGKKLTNRMWTGGRKMLSLSRCAGLATRIPGVLNGKSAWEQTMRESAGFARYADIFIFPSFLLALLPPIARNWKSI